MTLPLPTIRQWRTTCVGWTYRAPKTPVGRGAANLTIWDATYPDGTPGILAMVSNCDDGLSVTNGIEYIERAVRAQYADPDMPVTLIEHTDAGHLDEAWTGSDGRGCWRRIWPTPEANPAHAEFDAWTEANAEHLHAAGVTALEGMARL